MASQSSTHSGLTAAQVAERIAQGQVNAFKARVGRTYWQIIRDNVLNLFNIVLGILLIIVIFFQDYSTALFAGFSVVTNSILGMVQEINAKRKLDRLAAQAVQDAAVWRDGALVRIPIDQIVLDEVILIEPGDRLVVDGKVLHSDALEMDESQLTGESDAVFKEDGSEVYSGSFCIAGTGLMTATKIGKNSTINKLSTVAKAYKNVKTPTQQRISALVEVTVVAMLVLVPMLFIAGYRNGDSLLEIVKSEVVFVSSIVPQGLVLVAVLSLTLGAISISRFQTLIQRVNAVESMANVSVLCFDKTGTLTRNQLAVTEVIPLNGTSTEQIYNHLRAYLKNLGHLNRTAAAVATYVEQAAGGGTYAVKQREIPFNSSRKWGAVIFESETLVMGAPERLLPSASNNGLQAAAHQVQELTVQGMRVLAFGRSQQPPVDGHLSSDYQPMALIILSDQVRPDIRETLDSFREQNVRLKVISGDNLETVKSIAAEAGLSVGLAYTGDQLEAMTDRELETAAAEADVFARIEPDTKRRIIAALKHQGEYVAMVGDGVNDVPALKEAHLAIVMNDGAQITKDIGDIVLLNNAMSTLPKAFSEGTLITQTIYATSKLFLTKNFYNIVLIFFVGFMTLPFPTTPIQISWITFGTVNIPATLLAFKIIRPAYMAQFRRDVLDYVLTAGAIGAVMLALLYILIFYDSRDTFTARSAVTMFIAFYGTFIFWNIQGIDLFQPRSFITYWRVTLTGIVLTAFTLLAPFLLPETFQFIPPTSLQWGLIVTIFVLTAVLVTVAMRSRQIINQLWILIRP